MRYKACLALILLLAGCGAGQIPVPKMTESPAARYCLQIGGQLHVQRDANRGEVGYCHLPNGTIVEEWALFRGRRG